MQTTTQIKPQHEITKLTTINVIVIKANPLPILSPKLSQYEVVELTLGS